MHKRARAWHTWLQVGVLVSFLVGAGYWLASAGTSSLDREGAKSVLGELRSQAAVGRLLTEQAAKGQLTGVFLREQVGQIRKNVDAERKQLSQSGVGPEVVAQSMRGGTLAGRLSDAYAGLANFPGDPKAAEALGKEFERLFKELKSLEDSLGE